MRKTTLVVLAAGMGSRFGGMKQIAPLGPNGEILIDFSVYDAVKAGFDKVVMIIKKEHEADFREVVGKRIEKMVDVEYAFQQMDDIPAGLTVPEGRTKPWGTAHAIMCCEKVVDSPFGVINADDYYGQQSYKLLHDHLVSSDEMCNIGFRLGQTLTDNGSVSRGICAVKDGYLAGVDECKAITKDSGIPLDSVASMNMWGLFPSLFGIMEEKFRAFYAGMTNPMKDEFYLPLLLDELIRTQGAKIKVIPTPEKWFGVTYKEDSPAVKAAMTDLIERGLYKGL